MKKKLIEYVEKNILVNKKPKRKIKEKRIIIKKIKKQTL